MDDAVHTFEQILHQSLEAPGTEDLLRTIQRCQDRVLKVSCPLLLPPEGEGWTSAWHRPPPPPPPSLRAPSQKFDYDSSSVRKRFFREALLQIFVPYMLKQLGPSCACVSPDPTTTTPQGP